MEKIFLSAIAGTSSETESLEELIKSGTSVFDILPSFFFHHNRSVRVAALEVSPQQPVSVRVAPLEVSPRQPVSIRVAALEVSPQQPVSVWR